MQNRLEERQIPVYDRIAGRNLAYYVANGTAEYTLYNSDDYHFHDMLELGVCISGKGLCCVDGEVYPYRAQSCQLVLPSVPHYTVSTADALSVWRWVFISPRDFLELSQESETTNYPDILCNRIARMGVFDETRFPAVAEALRRFCAELGAPSAPYKADICRLQLKMCLMQLLRASEGMPPRRIQIPNINSRIQTALHSIRASVRQGAPISVCALAAENGISPSHFRAEFKQTVGVSPKAYAVRQAVRLAQEYLLSTEDSVETVAERVGFGDVSGLYRNFIALHGISPMEYRRRWKK